MYTNNSSHLGASLKVNMQMQWSVDIALSFSKTYVRHQDHFAQIMAWEAAHLVWTVKESRRGPRHRRGIPRIFVLMNANMYMVLLRLTEKASFGTF